MSESDEREKQSGPHPFDLHLIPISVSSPCALRLHPSHRTKSHRTAPCSYVDPAARGFKTCQLKARHWIITDGHGHEDHVRGEAVVGKQPLFFEGGWKDLGDAGDFQDHTGK